MLRKIYQSNRLPIINEKVIVPDLPKGKSVDIASALAAIPGSSYQLIDGDYMIVLPEFEYTYPEDWYEYLRAVAV